MSHYPGFPPPSDPSLGYYARQPAGRPTSVVIMSILAMIFGGLFTFCGVIGSVMALVGVAMGRAMQANPMFNQAAVQNSPAVNAYNAIATIIMLVLSVWLLMTGIGGMSLKPWARRAGIFWAIAMIVISTIETIIGIAWVNPAIRKSQPGNPMLQLGSGFFTGTSIVIWILSCILPVFFLILWRRPEVKAAFGEPTTASGV